MYRRYDDDSYAKSVACIGQEFRSLVRQLESFSASFVRAVVAVWRPYDFAPRSPTFSVDFSYLHVCALYCSRLELSRAWGRRKGGNYLWV